MRYLVIVAAALSALALAAGTTAVSAQPAGRDRPAIEDRGSWWAWGGGHGMMGWGAGPMSGWPGHRSPMMGGPGRMGGGPAQYIDGRIAFLRAELKITAEQAPLFDAYAQALRGSAEAMQVKHERMWSGDLPEAMPDRLQWQIDETTQRLDALQKIKAAALPLYDALSREQKGVADTLMSPMGMM